MPRGDKDKYTDKQKRKAEHIAEGYEERGASEKEAKSHAWATVNKESGGGNKSGSGRGKKDTHESSSRGGRAHKSGSSSFSRSPILRPAGASRSVSIAGSSRSCFHTRPRRACCPIPT